MVRALRFDRPQNCRQPDYCRQAIRVTISNLRNSIHAQTGPNFDLSVCYYFCRVHVKLPPILGKEQLWAENAQYPYQTHAYELAAKIPVVLHQQPCYCYCDRMGHNSLHSCFETTHGAECSTCLKELYYSYSMHQKGKTAAQIRKGIIVGEWKQVNWATAASIN